VGDKGEKIVKKMGQIERVSWTIVVRTCMIDDYIREAIEQGIDTILNLGAGLDTRPYRMEFSHSLQWIEADYPALIDFKQEKLKKETPRCQLERAKVDLSDRESRNRFFSDVQSRSKRVLVLTEGVVPYLTNENVLELAKDLKAHERFEYWIVDYWSKRFAELMKGSRFFKNMGNAPFVFSPPEWKEFFKSAGWSVEQIRYTGVEGSKLGRPTPMPLWARMLKGMMSQDTRRKIEQMTGYALLRANGS
jgi:methyltransferase (TIGR00027 family)